MNDLRKAAEMALKALEFAASEIYNEHNDDVIADAIKALRQALAQPEQEPVAWLEYDEEGYLFLSGKRKGAFPVFTDPPSKPWVSLTDEEIYYIWSISPGDYEDKFAFPRAIEAKLHEKNT